jgi:signal transduction histidine kinase/CheY-like chemotaxis protein
VLCPAEGRGDEAAVLQRVIAAGRIERYEADRVCKDLTVIPVSVTAAPVLGPAGAIAGVTTVSWQVSRKQGRDEARSEAGRRAARGAQERREVTAYTAGRDALEREERLQAQLQQAQRLENLGQLAGGVAHDFNNLLAVILNYVSFVSEELAAASESDFSQRLDNALSDLVHVKQATERAVGLTRQLLAFARREVVRPQVLDLDNVIAAVGEMLRRTIGEHVELVISLAGDLWPVLADPGQLEQVLVNLAVNARDAMPAGGTLTIDTGNITVDDDSAAGGSKAQQGRNVRLRVSDTGTGMAADVIQHAFEPFFTTKEAGAGTGLGLATVYGILAQAEGNIQIYSEPGTGTTFTITLPVTTETAIPILEPVPYQRVPKGETVLVVEDSAALREVTKRIFTRNGYQVITAANGPEALDIACAHAGEIHLLVTDVVMPHMLGKEVAEKMRAIKPEIEVLFMSGYARPVLTSQGRLDPNVALVEKPFSEADLLAMAGQVLNGHFHGFKTVKGTPS